MGLYLAYEVGDRHYHERGIVRAETLIHPDDGGVLGANIELNGFRFIMWLHPKVPGTSAFSGVLIGPRGAALTYHPKKAIFKHASQELIFEWASFFIEVRLTYALAAHRNQRASHRQLAFGYQVDDI